MKSTQTMARCEIHGRKLANDPNGPKWVIVPKPKTKRERREGGCPSCLLERRKQQQAE